MKSEFQQNDILFGEKLTALYLRLSRDDDFELESNSIANQRVLLTNFARQNRFKNIEIFVDDGISGVTFNRPSFQKILELIENDRVSTLIIKDMSRLGRNYIEVGQLMETILPMHNVRLIAVNDGVDTSKGIDDFTPFRNIINEWYAKDISKKIRSALKTKDSQGYAIGKIPFGYIPDKKNPKLWVIDEKNAKVVRTIFEMRLEGKSVNYIARYLNDNNVLTPKSRWERENCVKTNKKSKYIWYSSTVSKMLANEKYIGNVVNFKFTRKSFKLKKQFAIPKENWKIHENVHSPIIEREKFLEVQKTFEKTKMRKPKIRDKNMFAGLLKCSECGSNLSYKSNLKYPDSHYFSCRVYSMLKKCKNTHYVRVDFLTKIAQRKIFGLIKFAMENKNEFLKIIKNKNNTQNKISKNENTELLKKLIIRKNEIDTLFQKIFEEKTFGRLSEEKFLMLSEKYENEQLSLKEKIKNLKIKLIEAQEKKLSLEIFFKNVEKFSKAKILTREILHTFIDKIVVFHKQKNCPRESQRIDFYFNIIGNVEIKK